MARSRKFLALPNVLSGTFLTIFALLLVGCGVKTLEERAEDGDADAQFNLAQIYDTGDFDRDGNPDENYVDLAQAALWYGRAAEQGHVEAQYQLAIMYDNGDGVQEDPAQAIEWYRKAAKQGHVESQYQLAMMYDNGDGVQKDPAQAIEWSRKAAEQGHVDAQHQLAQIYEREELKKEADEKIAEVEKSASSVEDNSGGNLKEIVARVMPSVGTVMIRKDKGYVPNGSGFFISEDGHFVTNWHVVDDGQSFRVKREDGATFEVKEMLYANPKHDLAILNVDGTGFKPLTLGGSNEISVAGSVAVIGSPQGLGGSVTEGIVSAIRDYGDIFPDQTMAKNTKCIQVSAAISPGSSGSAIVSLETGKAIAVATFFHKGGQSLNFGVAAEHISELLATKKTVTDITSNTKPTETGFKPKALKWPDPSAYKKFEQLLTKGTEIHNTGNLRGAIEVHTEALKVAKENVGTNHPDYAKALVSVATSKIYLGEVDLAEPLLTKAAKTLKTHDKTSGTYADCLRTMGDYYRAKNSTIDARGFYKDALDIYYDIQDADSDIFPIMSGLIAETYIDSKQYDKALPLFKSALSEWKKLSRPRVVASSYLDIGSCYSEMKQYDDAIYYLKIAGQKYRDIEGKNGEMVDVVLTFLGNTYYKVGNSRMGDAIWKEARRIKEHRRSQEN